MSEKKKFVIKMKEPFDMKGLKESPEQFAKGMTDDAIGKTLDYLSNHYYNGVSLVEDAIFDALQDILRNRNPEHPSLSFVGAPVTGLSGKVTDKPVPELEKAIEVDILNAISISGPAITNLKHRDKAELPYWMGSMDKVKPGTGALVNWLSKYGGDKVVSDKMDGASALLVYHLVSGTSFPPGIEVSLYTRGDGTYGQDISCLLPYLRMPTLNVEQIKKTIGSNQLAQKGIILAIRAELIMSKANFEQFAKQVPNARNLVSGIVNSKTIKTKLVELVDFIAYECIEPAGLKPSDQFALIKKLGFQTAPTGTSTTIDEAWLTQYFADRKKNSSYEIDGIIVTEDSVHPRNTSKNPKYAVAFKMMVDEAEQVAQTEVLSVDWVVQKDGYLFPVIKVKPVFVSGTTIQNCSGKNAKYMIDNCIGPGAIVKVTRDGDVIPGIYEIVKIADNQVADMPDPVEMPYHWTTTGVNIVMDNIEDNETVQLKRMVSFFQKMGVAGFGEGMIARCFADPKLDTIPKILSASVNDFMGLPGVQIKMATKIHQAIASATASPDLGTVMVASNVFGRGYGERKIKSLLTSEPGVMDWDTTLDTKGLIGRICQIDGFDTKTAQQFATRLQAFKDFLKTLPTDFVKRIVYPSVAKSVATTALATTATITSAASIVPTGVFKINIKAQQQQQKRFQGQTIVFTGVRNKDWEKIIEDEGGKVGSAVSGNTSMVVIKDHSFTSGKITKAQSLNVKVLSMDEFQTLFKLQSN